jgi:hypothetical protein
MRRAAGHTAATGSAASTAAAAAGTPAATAALVALFDAALELTVRLTHSPGGVKIGCCTWTMLAVIN